MKVIKLAGVGMVTALLCACGPSGSSGEDGSAKVAQMRLGPSLEKAAQQPQLLNDYPCSTADSKKVMLCHVPPGNPDAKHTICVGRPALNAHLREHNRSGEGDYLGDCNGREDDGSGGSDPGTDPGTGTGGSGNGGDSGGNGGGICDVCSWM